MKICNFFAFFWSVLFLFAASVGTAQSQPSDHWLPNYYQCLKKMNWQSVDEHLPLTKAVRQIEQGLANKVYGPNEHKYSKIAGFFKKAKVLWIHYEKSTVLMFVSEKVILPVVLNESTRSGKMTARQKYSGMVVDGMHKVAITEETGTLPPLFLSVRLGKNRKENNKRVGWIQGLSLGAAIHGTRNSDYVEQPLNGVKEEHLRKLVSYGIIDKIQNIRELLNKSPSISLASLVAIPTAPKLKPSVVRDSLVSCRELIRSNRDLDIIMELDSAVMDLK